MGGAVTTGRSNDDLVDNLLSADYIRTPAVQKLFRAVDRADYFLPQRRSDAYKDIAWRSGHLHISAPCIYSEVMEGLCLKPNLSFLNLGSGTGYLSTMVGLAIGSGGINHGIEIYQDVIEYANQKLEEFKRQSSAIDEFDFCEPKFIQGNCLRLANDTLPYDRVYCGGACPTTYISYMKSLIKVGGILVMPVEDQLMQIERTSETSWVERSLLPVAFATLLTEEGSEVIVGMLDVEPPTLQHMCRTVVRNVLRNNINKEFPKLKSRSKRKRMSKKKCALRRTTRPHFERSDEGEGTHSGAIGCTNGYPLGTVGAFFDIVLGRIPDSWTAAFLSEQNASSDGTESENRSEQQEDDSNHDNSSDISNMLGTSLKVASQTDEPSQSAQSNSTNNGGVIARITIRKRNRDDGIEEGSEESGIECNTDSVNSTTPNKTNSTEISTSIKTKREKFDSGLGDEIVGTSFVEAAQNMKDQKNRMYVDSSSSSEEEDSIPSKFEHQKEERQWETVDVPTHAVDHILGHLDDDENSEDESESIPNLPPVTHPFTLLMRNRIEELPLPQTLKNYVNYYKEY